MPITINQLSDKARELLTTALAGGGRSKGLIVLTQTLSGGGYVIAGDSQREVYGNELADAQRAIDELHDYDLVLNQCWN